jgi:hypothetical protein
VYSQRDITLPSLCSSLFLTRSFAFICSSVDTLVLIPSARGNLVGVGVAFLGSIVYGYGKLRETQAVEAAAAVAAGADLPPAKAKEVVVGMDDEVEPGLASTSIDEDTTGQPLLQRSQ